MVSPGLVSKLILLNTSSSAPGYLNDTFLKDIQAGFTANPKFISSHYFYDKAGDELFQQIMEMPEYYLTNSELEIFSEQSDAIIQSFEISENEEVLEALINRMNFLNGEFPCRENSIVITHLETALLWLEKRTNDRIKRNVEGKNEK